MGATVGLHAPFPRVEHRLQCPFNSSPRVVAMLVSYHDACVARTVLGLGQGQGSSPGTDKPRPGQDQRASLLAFKKRLGLQVPPQGCTGGMSRAPSR